MSHHFEGHYYPTQAGYDEAVRERDLARARESASRGEREASRLGARARRREQELAEAQAELQQEQARGRNLEGNVNALREHQSRLDAAHARFERAQQGLRRDLGELGNVQRQLAERQAAAERRVEQHFTQLATEIKANAVDIERLRSAQARHVALVREQFTAMDEKIDAGLDQAEARRAETEARMVAALGEADQRLTSRIDGIEERDRADRAERLGRADALATLAEDRLRLLLPMAERVSMESEVEALGEQLALVRRRAAAGDRDASVLAESASADVRAHTRTAHRRAAELEATRDGFLERTRHLRAMVAESGVEEFFAHERAAVLRVLDAADIRFRDRYTVYRRIEVESEFDEVLLRRIESNVFTMVTSVGEVRTLFDRRKKSIPQIVQRFTGLKGAPLARLPDAHLEVQGDPKSAIVLDCDFGGTRGQVRLTLEGDVQVDSYGHATNASCADEARRAQGAFGQSMVITNAKADTTARSTPIRSSDSAPSQWADLARSLANLEKS